MRNWPALIVGPLLALAAQSVMYALVIPACSRNDRLLTHIVAAAALVIAAALTAIAWRNWRTAIVSTSKATTMVSHRELFLARITTLSGVLSSIVIVAMWLPQWILSPCPL